jgi:hypothetical protein
MAAVWTKWYKFAVCHTCRNPTNVIKAITISHKKRINVILAFFFA